MLQNRDTFSSYHPLVNFLYFGLVLLLTMFLMHPVSLLISLGSALCYGICLNGGRAVRSGMHINLKEFPGFRIPQARHAVGSGHRPGV